MIRRGKISSRLTSLPGLGLRRLQGGESLPDLSTFMSSWWSFNSSSLSVVLSSVADSLPDCSAEVTFSSTLSSDGPSASTEEEEDVDEGGSGFSRFTVEGVSFLSLAPNVPSGEASFCFWSCSFCRLRCFLRNFARRFLNHTWFQKKNAFRLKQAETFRKPRLFLIVWFLNPRML